MRTHGFSLVELIIGLAISSMILLCATQLLLVSQREARFQQQQVAIYNDGRFVLEFLARLLRRAGYSTSDDLKPVVFPIQATENLFGAPLGNLHSKDGERFDELVLAIDGANDCAGANSTRGLLRVYVTNNTLRCATYELDAGAFNLDDHGQLARSVYAFQVLYGLDTDLEGQPGYGSVNRYLTASDYDRHLGRVISVQLAVVLAGEQSAASLLGPRPGDIEVLGRTFKLGSGAGALNLRPQQLAEVFTTTVALPNARHLVL